MAGTETTPNTIDVDKVNKAISAKLCYDLANDKTIDLYILLISNGFKKPDKPLLEKSRAYNLPYRVLLNTKTPPQVAPLFNTTFSTEQNSAINTFIKKLADAKDAGADAKDAADGADGAADGADGAADGAADGVADVDGVYYSPYMLWLYLNNHAPMNTKPSKGGGGSKSDSRSRKNRSRSRRR